MAHPQPTDYDIPNIWFSFCNKQLPKYVKLPGAFRIDLLEGHPGCQAGDGCIKGLMSTVDVILLEAAGADTNVVILG